MLRTSSFSSRRTSPVEMKSMRFWPAHARPFLPTGTKHNAVRCNLDCACARGMHGRPRSRLCESAAMQALGVRTRPEHSEDPAKKKKKAMYRGKLLLASACGAGSSSNEHESAEQEAASSSLL